MPIFQKGKIYTVIRTRNTVSLTVAYPFGHVRLNSKTKYQKQRADTDAFFQNEETICQKMMPTSPKKTTRCTVALASKTLTTNVENDTFNLRT